MLINAIEIPSRLLVDWYKTDALKSSYYIPPVYVQVGAFWLKNKPKQTQTVKTSNCFCRLFFFLNANKMVTFACLCNFVNIGYPLCGYASIMLGE